ncbi:MAG: ankyrin repeat domain-containing protein [Phycisphaerales bacterium]|nr:ankyrin repeat domain-containing protein [Phycisphaerales bacterium]
MIECCYRDDVPGIRQLLEVGADPNERESRSGRTALLLATSFPMLPRADEIFSLLLTFGADVNASDMRGWTALHFAAQRHDLLKAAALIEHGAVVDAEDEHGNTPLCRATFESRGRGEMIQLLLDAGADRHRPNKHGISALALAMSIANYDVARYFRD